MTNEYNPEFFEEEEKNAEETGLPAPLDCYLCIKMAKSSFAGSFSFDDIKKLLDEVSLSDERIRSAIDRLDKFGVLDVNIYTPGGRTPEELIHLENTGHMVMKLPRWADIHEMNNKELEKLIFEKIIKIREEIAFEVRKKNFFQEFEGIKKEVEKTKEDILRTKEDMMRNMVGIFAIFISIFSFIIIGSSSAISIQPKGIYDLLKVSGVILIPIVVLLLLTYVLFIHHKST